ncbi:exonuclease SbcCD subunit D [Verrucomicrobiota bacterium]
MPTRLLCIGDIHLGKRPAELPEHIEQYGVSAAVLSPVQAWRNTVQWALDNDVHAALLAGDVVHRSEDRFEAYGHLAEGVRRLVDAGIPVCAVAGNHDSLALPRLAAQIPEVRLLGRGGRWELLELTARNGSAVQLAGWSFPTQHVTANPLDSFDLTPDPDLPSIGLIHCDLDASTSRFAPVRRSDFARALLDFWALGHIHIPSELQPGDRFGYLGSLVGLDPGETGCRGPWLLTVEDDRRLRPEPAAATPPGPCPRVGLPGSSRALT